MLMYSPFDIPATEEWLELLNSDSVRKHLLEHPLFAKETLQDWLQDIIEEDSKLGCRLRTVQSEGNLAGWRGIQIESRYYEVALVLSPKYWGHGREVIGGSRNLSSRDGPQSIARAFAANETADKGTC